MFDNTKPNVILFADNTDIISLKKSYGIYKVAHTLRQHGIQVAVIHHLSIFSVTEIFKILDTLISDKTLFVGVNNFYYADISTATQTSDGGAVLKNSSPGMIIPHGLDKNQPIKNFIKSKNPRCRLVLGGPAASDNSHNKFFDYIVLGYAEMSIVNLANHLIDPSVQLKQSYRSIFGPIIIDDSKAQGYNFSSCSMNYEDYDVIFSGETLMIEIARGCIFNCSFCSFPLNGKKKMDFVRSTDLLQQELIDNYEKFGVTRYVFCDDTVNDSPEKCKMLYELSQSLPFDLEWWGYIRLDLLAAHPETIDYLFKSGLRAAHFGIETFNSKSAAAIGKGGNREKLIATIQKIKDTYGDQVSLHGSFIFGLPYESIESMKQTEQFLLSENNPLDSWEVYALHIKPSNHSFNNQFLSDIDKNYTKYGYREIDQSSNDNKNIYAVSRHAGTMIWENEHTNRLEVEKMVGDLHDYRQKHKIRKVTGQSAFYFAGAGADMSQVLNKSFGEIDWNKLDRLKIVRAIEYKTKLYDRLGINCDAELYQGFETFGQVLASKILLK